MLRLLSKLDSHYSDNCKDRVNKTIPGYNNTYFCFIVAQQPNSGLGCPFVVVSRSHKLDKSKHTHTFR
jgi:hypothetical protein